MFGCVEVDLGGIGLGLSCLAFGKDLNYLNNGQHEATGPGDIINCAKSPCTEQAVSLKFTPCKSQRIPRTGTTGDDKPMQLDVDLHHQLVTLSLITSAVLSCEWPLD